MKETRFITQNKEKWLESETLLKNPEKDPEKLSNLFTQVIDDLSYARTYYPNRSVRVYLNNIARKYFSIIYSHQKGRKHIFKNFWVDELPQIVYFSRRALILSLVIFLISVCIGIFSSMNDPHFASSILGAHYVAMTKANILKGDPMAVYKQGHQVDMFLGITFNNLLIAFRTYVFGIFLSVGTIGLLLYNGIMVGCFQFFFIERGLFAESALTIWLHGTLEISSIVLAGGAGLTLGSGLLFPGTYSRLQAFQISAIRSLKLMLGITPVFVLAALIESFLTRYTDVPDALRLFLILLSGVFIIGYFVVYPWLKSRKGFDRPLSEVKLPATKKDRFVFDGIKNNAEIIKDAFMFYNKYSGKLFSWIALITALMAGAEFFSPESRTITGIRQELWQSFFSDLFYAMKTPSAGYMVINALGSGFVLFLVFTLLDQEKENRRVKFFQWRSLVHTLAIIFVLYALLYLLGGWGTLLVIFSFGLLILYAYTQHAEGGNIFSSFSRTWKLASEMFGQVVGLQSILLLMSLSFLIILSAPLLYMNISILEWNFAKGDDWSREIIGFIQIYLKLLAFHLVLPVIGSSVAFLYFSLREIGSADNLKESIRFIGVKNTKTTAR